MLVSLCQHTVLKRSMLVITLLDLANILLKENKIACGPEKNT